MLGTYLKPFFFGLILITVFSCDFINPDEPAVSYIQVDSVNVISTAEYGSNSNDINDLWIYVDGKLVGTYEIPFKVPVLPSGDQTITLETGIKDNGMGLFRVIYPFYTSYTIDTILPEGGTIKIYPTYHYDDAEIALLEDFEDLGINFEITSSSDTTLMTINNENSFEGNCGYVALDAEHTIFDCKTSQLYDLPRDSKVYVELDYRCDEELTIGLFGRVYSSGSLSDVRYPIVTLYPTDGKWKKVYVNLTDEISDTPQAWDYRIFMSAIKTSDTEGEIAEIYLDNIKILYY
jgi:hypothetical protein